MPVNLIPINGTSANDLNLLGTPGDDTFNVIHILPAEGGGEDKMTGGDGDDTYYVNSLKDVVVEAKAPLTGPNTAGIDTVMASISYKLAPNVEHLVLTGSGNLTGIGNDLANEIYGNAKDNVLNGGANADTLHGGAGNDTYIFDNLGDVADETAGGLDAGGNDTIRSSVFSAGFFSKASQHQYIENFSYTGKLAWTFEGDAQNNRITGSVGTDTIYGNDGNDWLDGGKGADLLHGGKGDDTFTIDNKADRVFEDLTGANASTHDLIRASLSIDLNAAKLKLDKTIDFKLYDGVEDVVLTGKGGLNAFGRDGEDNRLTGNDGSNILDGKGGNDALYGGPGKDVLVAGAGDDFLDGGEGLDTMVLSGSKDDYTIRLNVSGSMVVRDDNPGDGNDGSDRILNIEMLRFSDVKMMPLPNPIVDSDGATANVLREEDPTQNGLPVGIVAQAHFVGDLPVFYSLVNDGGIFAIDSVTGVVTLEHGALLDFETNHGQYNLIVRATAEKGPALEREFPITILDGYDVPPATPILNQTFLNDTGMADGITADTTPTLSGTSVEIGNPIKIYDTYKAKTTLVGTTTVLPDGTWSLTLAALPDGQHVFEAVVQNVLGTPSASSAPLGITIDTVAPAAPVIDGLTAATDTGASNTDNITKTTTPTVRGQASGEAGGLVHLYTSVGGNLTEIGTGVVGALGNWTATVTSALSSGLYDIQAKIEDGAGQVGPLSTTYQLTIDTVAPNAPTLKLSVGSDTGTLGDNATSDNTPTLVGTAEAFAKVHLFNDANAEIGSTLADASGNWLFTVITDLSTGIYNFTAKAEDVAGNLSGVSSTLTLNIYTPFADTPTINPTFQNDTGVADGVTADTTPTLSGTSTEIGGKLDIYDTFNGVTTLVGSTPVLFGGVWTLTTGGLQDGVHVFKASVLDLLGNTSALSTALTIKIDTITPLAPSIGGLTALTDTGLSSSDGITNNTTPTASGQAAGEMGSFVHLYKVISNVLTEVGTGVVDAQGNWTAPITAPLTSGVYDLKASIEDGAGHVGPVSAAYQLTIDTVAPAGAPTLTLSPASNTGVQGDTTTGDTTPTLRGTTEAFAKVHVFDGSNAEIGSAIADVIGRWSFTVGSPLAVGAQNFAARAEDVAGNLGPISVPLALTINNNLSPASPTLDPTSESGSSLTDGITKDSTPTINVTGSGTLHLFQDGVEVVLGANTYTPGAPLSQGEHLYTLAIDGVTDASAALIVDVDTVAPTAVSLSNPKLVDENQAGPFAVGTLGSTDAHAVAYALGGADAASFTLGIDGRTVLYTGAAVNFEIKPSFSLSITATDVADNITVQALSVNVRDRLETITATQSAFFLSENGVLTPFATVSADGVSTLSLVGSTADYFTLAGGTLSAKAALNFEDSGITDADNDLSNGKQLVAHIKASNGIDPDLFQDMTLTIIDVVESKNVSAGDSILSGGIGSDILTGGNNSDSLYGNGGNDLLIGLSGGDLLDGGPGSDTVSYATSGAVTVNLASGEATGGHAANDGLVSIENLIGSANADTLTGDIGDNVLEGGLGNDILDGGSNGIYGDTVSYAGATAGVTVSLALSTIQNTVNAGSDTLTHFENIQGSGFNDNLTGNSSDNILIGGAGADVLNGGAGLDTASYFNAPAAVIANLQSGGTGGDGAGDTYVGVENLLGSIYNDTLVGDGIANVITGGGGHDILTGNAGNDSFKYQLNPGALLSEAHSDTILDFTVGDKIDLTDLHLDKAGTLGFQGLIDGGYLSLKGDKVYADLDGGGDGLVLLFTLNNVDVTALHAADFAF